jgi:hypothetical protein
MITDGLKEKIWELVDSFIIDPNSVEMRMFLMDLDNDINARLSNINFDLKNSNNKEKT